MNKFSDSVKYALEYYVYALVDPRDNKKFYIGGFPQIKVLRMIFQRQQYLDSLINGIGNGLVKIMT